MNKLCGFLLKAFAVTAIVAVITVDAFAQTDMAYVPFKVNVAAVVKAYLGSATPVQKNIAAGVIDTLKLPLGSVSVRYAGGKSGEQNAPLVSGSRGNITLRLSTQSYNSAEIALYSVNGRRICAGLADASKTAASIARRNVAAGIYMLSVKGTSGAAFTTRLTHSGGNLNINAVFGDTNASLPNSLGKSAAEGDYAITVSATGYHDSSYTLSPVKGDNPLQDITLRARGLVVTDAWTWTSYDDAGNGGTSTIVMSESNGAVTMAGAVTAANGYAGLISTPNSAELAHLRLSAEAISFKVKGDGKQYRVMLPTSDVTDNGYFQTTITAPTEETTVYLNIEDFKQPSGAKQVVFDYGSLEWIQWQTGNGFSGNFNLRISDLKLLDEKYYKVTFSANGGGGAVPPAQYGGDITLPSGEGMTRTGYVFDGWAASSSAMSGLQAGASYNPTANVTLYAAWRQINTVTFNLNGGRGTSPAAQTVTTGDTITLPTGEGFTNGEMYFGGWNTNSSGSGTNYEGGGRYSPTGNGNITLYAKWRDTPLPVITTFTDSRDNKTYKQVTIGSQVWMGENLNYDVPNVTSDVCYNNADSNCTKYGRLYNWSTAMNGATSSSAVPSGVQGVCPSGWHLPSDAEWTQLTDFVGGASTAGKKLKSTSGWNNNGNGTDDFGFSALPGGNGYSDGNFYNAGRYGYWWSATEYNASIAWRRLMGYDVENVSRDYDGKTFLFSVRCVQD